MLVVEIGGDVVQIGYCFYVDLGFGNGYYDICWFEVEWCDDVNGGVWVGNIFMDEIQIGDFEMCGFV